MRVFYRFICLLTIFIQILTAHNGWFPTSMIQHQHLLIPVDFTPQSQLIDIKQRYMIFSGYIKFSFFHSLVFVHSVMHECCLFFYDSGQYIKYIHDFLSPVYCSTPILSTRSLQITDCSSILPLTRYKLSATNCSCSINSTFILSVILRWVSPSISSNNSSVLSRYLALSRSISRSVSPYAPISLVI